MQWNTQSCNIICCNARLAPYPTPRTRKALTDFHTRCCCLSLLLTVWFVSGEVDSARRIAERALSTITMTAEREKFNVWVALMNLEDAYGGDGAEDALMAAFNRSASLLFCTETLWHLLVGSAHFL